MKIAFPGKAEILVKCVRNYDMIQYSEAEEGRLDRFGGIKDRVCDAEWEVLVNQGVLGEKQRKGTGKALKLDQRKQASGVKNPGG